jgi:purine nucleosidase
LPIAECTHRRCIVIAALLCFALRFAMEVPLAAGQAPLSARASDRYDKTKIILDTDIGDDVDDAFALALALKSPEIEIVGVTTAWGDTKLRARLVERMLAESGTQNIPVAAGVSTRSKTPFTQAVWARSTSELKGTRPEAVEFLLTKIREHPNEITLVAIGPLTNIGAAIERDGPTFAKLKRVVLMGGSMRRGYNDLGYGPDHGPDAEYNIVSDVPAAQRLFASGVPIFMMPLDSTQLKLDEIKRAFLFAAGTPITNALAALYYQWGQPTPTLFDAMAVAYAIDPKLCPVESIHVTVDNAGYTRVGSGAANASACLASDSEQFFRFLLPRLMDAPR